MPAERTKRPVEREMPPELLARIKAAKARAVEKRQAEKERENRGLGGPPTPQPLLRGLKVPLHPLLSALPTAIAKTLNPVRNPQSIASLLGSTPRDQFTMNPYLDQASMGRLSTKRQDRGLRFNEKGVYTAKADAYRARLAEEAAALAKTEALAAQGLVADRAMGEELFVPKMPPRVEWWDEPFLKQRNYEFTPENINSCIVQYDPEAEDPPITLYVQHPVPMRVPGETPLQPAKLYLTKKELKKLRRNNRSELDKEKQDRIRLGLDPTPKPKVKLRNLMNVLANEAIRDPTQIEMQVREEIAQRQQHHLELNEARHQQALETRPEKALERKQLELAKGIFTAVFRIDRLVNPQHRFKMNINARQLSLTGLMLLPEEHEALAISNPKAPNAARFSLVIVEGLLKSVALFVKLMLSRIDWAANAAPKRLGALQPPEPLEDLSHNRCLLLWEGQLKDFHFQRWSSSQYTDADEAVTELQRFGVESYWREATAVDSREG